MARYKEVWESFVDPTVIEYIDTDNGVHVPVEASNTDYQEVADWIADGNTPDPAFTLAERQVAAIAQCQTILEAKLSEPFVYGGHEYSSAPGHKNGLTMRLYAKDKSVNVKAIRTDGSVNRIDAIDAADFLDAWGDRDDLILDQYEVAVDDIGDATTWTAVAAAIATFEAS